MIIWEYFSKNATAWKALDVLEWESSSVKDFSTEKLLSLLKTQGINLTHDELQEYQKEFSSLSETEKQRFLARHARVSHYLPISIIVLCGGLFIWIIYKTELSPAN